MKPSPTPTTFPEPTAAGSLPHIGNRFRLLPGETVVAVARFDLDVRLHFTDGWIVLTTERLLADAPASADADGSSWAPGCEPGSLPLQAWSLDDSTQFDVRVRSGVGRIELSQAGRVVARWLFTPARAKSVQGLEDAFDQRGLAAGAARAKAGRDELRRATGASEISTALPAEAGGGSAADDDDDDDRFPRHARPRRR